MTEIKLTKNALREEQAKLSQLSRYLPTLQLKKALLQSEVMQARQTLQEALSELKNLEKGLRESAALLSIPCAVTWSEMAKVAKVETKKENIAGVDMEVLVDLQFEKFSPSALSSPIWTRSFAKQVRFFEKKRVEADLLSKALAALEKELREVSIRVNLFEKILIPRAKATMKKIRIFLQDQELAAVGRAKVAKSKHRRDVKKDPVLRESSDAH